MPKDLLLAILGSVWVMVFACLIVYHFPEPRAAVLHILADQGGTSASSESVRFLAAAALAAAPVSAAAIIAAATSTDYLPVNVYDYKLLQNVDPCTLTKLGAQGWNVDQIGGTIVPVGSSDENCQSNGNYTGMDWILFQRTHVINGGLTN